METQKNIIAVNEFGGVYKINEAYRPIARALKKKFKELEYVPVENILFVENLESKKKKNNKIIHAQISKVPGKWLDIIYQVTGQHFEYMLEVFKENNWEMSREQIVALIYHELRHIQLVLTVNGPKVDIVSHDIEDWTNMIQKLGTNWANTKGEIPDLLDANVDWESIEGPATLFPAETVLRLVK
jgi:predicted metallopeptidase